MKDVIEDLKKRAVHRSKILQGQMKGLEKMIENEEYCVDVLVQSLAIQKSLRSLNKLMLENHIKTHIDQKFSSGETAAKKEATNELLRLYELFNIRSS